MNMPIVQRIELCFWDVVILLLSRSTFVRKTVQFVSRHVTKRDVLTGLAMVATAGIAGLLVGFIVPVLLTFLK